MKRRERTAKKPPSSSMTAVLVLGGAGMFRSRLESWARRRQRMLSSCSVFWPLVQIEDSAFAIFVARLFISSVTIFVFKAASINVRSKAHLCEGSRSP